MYSGVHTHLAALIQGAVICCSRHVWPIPLPPQSFPICFLRTENQLQPPFFLSQLLKGFQDEKAGIIEHYKS